MLLLAIIVGDGGGRGPSGTRWTKWPTGSFFSAAAAAATAEEGRDALGRVERGEEELANERRASNDSGRRRRR